MHRTKLTIAGVIMGAFAAVVLGQNADQNTAGPTRNDYRLGVVEPAEGATVTGSIVRVYVNTQVREQLSDPENPRRDVNSMPRPDVDVFLDGALKGTLHAENNTLEIDNVSPGTHKLTFLAKNRSNEIIDRMETHFSSVEAVASSTTSSTTVSTAPPPPAPAPAPAPSTYSAPPPAPAPAYSAPPPPAPAPSTLPATASNDGALAIGGAALLLAALGLRRLSGSL